MRDVLTQWRASYAPGDWIVLSGPTSLVVLLPPAHGWTPMLDTLWREVLESTSLVELAGRLSQHGLDQMPSFGAFFWTAEGLRSLVRGAVVVRDASTGAVVADGHGIQTWTEIGLGDLACIRIDTSAGPTPTDRQLPLVVGAALASSVTLDARTEVSVPAPAETPLGSGPDGGPNPEEPDTEPMTAAERDAMENDDTELWSPSSSMSPGEIPSYPPSSTARLAISDGTVVELDRPLRIGRAPNAAGGPEDVLLVVVRSPQQDVSRTHLEVTEREGQVLVTDLHSTNGTTAVRPGATGAPERLPAGDEVPVPVGTVLDIGDNVSIRIEPSSPAAEHDTLGDL